LRVGESLPPAAAASGGEEVALSGGFVPAPFAERSDLASKIARRRFVVSVEVNPPVGLDPAKAVAAAKTLRAGGVDVVNIADGAPVYDLDSVGILKLAARLNRGVDPGGKPLGDTTRFVLATGAEPAALNYAREIERLRTKKAAGAEIVMTQPVYSPAVLERFL